jgi:tetratricopeptide (TPR) repeat protein
VEQDVNGGKVFKKLIKDYNDGKASFIKKMIYGDTSLFDENSFIDDAAITAKIERIKAEHRRLTDEIEFLFKHDKNDSYRFKKINDLKIQQRQLQFDIAFLASNSFNNLDACISFLDDIDTDFKLCLYGLKAYYAGDERDAFNKFYEYFKNKTTLLDHYLVNKIYGKILYNLKQYKQSIMLLQKAVEKRPDDLELHHWLREIYAVTGSEIEKSIEDEIVELLEVE